MCKKKIHLISNMYPSESNIRYGIFVKRFENLLKNDFEIRKIVISKKYNIVNKLFAYIIAYLQIIKLYFTSNVNDIIYVHFPLHFAPILFPFQFLNKKLVLNFHGSDAIFDSSLKKVLSVFLKPIVRTSTIVVPSEYFKNVVIETFNISAESIYVFPSGGVDETLFYPIKKEKKQFTLGFVSNFIKSKGWEILLEAFRLIENSNTIGSIRLIMVGDGPDKKNIISYIDKYNLNVKLIDSVNQNELVSIYSEFDVFIFPTLAESLGLVGLESLMCGVPIIASNVGGPNGYVENGVNGFLFKPKSKEGLVDTVMTYYKLNNEEKNKMIDESLNTAKLYESKIVVKGLITYLNNL